MEVAVSVFACLLPVAKIVPKLSLWNLRKAELLEVWRILTADENNVAQTSLKKSHNCQMVSPWVPAPPVPPSLPSTNISPPCHFRLLKMHTWNYLNNAVAVVLVCCEDFELSNVLTPDTKGMIHVWYSWCDLLTRQASFVGSGHGPAAGGICAWVAKPWVRDPRMGPIFSL